MRASARRLLAAAGVAAVAAGGVTGCSGRGSYTVTATFDDVGDLVRDHSVQVADVRVGRITGIDLTDDFRAEVRMSIRDSARIPRESVAYLRTTSLLGEKFVELRPVDAGAPDRGPYLADGDVVARAEEGPEIEFVAEEAIRVLGAVAADDVATLIDTGATGFGGRGDDLRSLIEDLATVSATLASRTSRITEIIDNLDRTTATLAGGADDVTGLLQNLSETTRVLAENRSRAVTALHQLSRLAAVQNDVLERYRADIDRQIEQVDAVLAVAAGQTAELGGVVDWLDRFVNNLPRVVPEDFTQVYMWLVPREQDPRLREGGG